MRMNKRANLSEETRRRIIAMDERGYDGKQIAAELNISASTVYRWKRRYRELGNVANKPRRKGKRRIPQAVEDRVVDMRLAGKRTGEIQRVTGLSWPTVDRICRRRGVWLI